MGCGSSTPTTVTHVKPAEPTKTSEPVVKITEPAKASEPENVTVVEPITALEQETLKSDVSPSEGNQSMVLGLNENGSWVMQPRDKTQDAEEDDVPTELPEKTVSPRMLSKRTSHVGIVTSPTLPIHREIFSSVTPNEPASELTIIHFNDVYNIEPRETEPVGGAARFVTKVRSFSDKNPLVLFSGDCLNPSLMSSVTKGKQMVPVMKSIGVHCAVYGNHDFDFGVDHLIEFKNASPYPWMIGNVKDKLTHTLLAEGVETVVAHWMGRKIGIIGLVEQEWLVTLATIDPQDVDYIDFVDCGRELAKRLREEQGCEFIIALTHMRVPNDMRLLESDAEIDLVLGGHDHHYETKEHNGRLFVKSGTDFREMTEITVHFDANNNKKMDHQRHEITKDIEEDPDIKAETDKYMEKLNAKMEDQLGFMNSELDGRFSTVRTKESNLGNFICDIMRTATQADIALLNSGSLRSDMVHPTGPFKMKDLVMILPMVDSLVVLEVSGEKLLATLENSVSQYPKFEGRFLQVSGISFVFDPEQPSGSRVVKDSVKLQNGMPLEMEKLYSVVTKQYLAIGKDGFDMLVECKQLVDEENGPILTTIVENHFTSIEVYKGRQPSRTGHRQSIVMKQEEMQTFMEQQRSKLAPKIEGRIRLITDPEPQIDPSMKRRMSRTRLRSVTQLSTVSSHAEHQELDQLVEAPETVEEEVMVLEEVEQQDDEDMDIPVLPDPSLDQVSEDMKMEMWEACRTDDIERLKGIVGEQKLDFRFFNMDKTLLHQCAQHNSVQCLEYLLTNGNLEANIRDETTKSTSLHYTAEYGMKEAAEILLKHDARVNAKNVLWETPLHIACQHQQGDVIILLLSRGADRTIKNKEGATAQI